MFMYLKDIYTKHRVLRLQISREEKIKTYIKNGRKPFSKGYRECLSDFIQKSINEISLLEIFRDHLPLPKQYGEFLSERVVEYPWLISRLDQGNSKLLDAGSTFNFSWILNHSKLQQKDITIVTLEPEANCYWKERVSYVYSDLRNLPFKDNYFDEVVSISTIEHIGMDNSLYSANKAFVEGKKLDFLKAVCELRRVTRPGGKIYITVPYGKYTDFGRFQQFSIEMINLLIETFAPNKLVETYYCYESGGWVLGDKQYCQKFDYFNKYDTKFFNPESTKDYDPDYAAASRAIAALELWK